MLSFKKKKKKKKTKRELAYIPRRKKSIRLSYFYFFRSLPAVIFKVILHNFRKKKRYIVLHKIDISRSS